MLTILNTVMSVFLCYQCYAISYAQAHIPQSHSEVPEADEDWPTLPSVLAFRDRVRDRLMRLYDDLDTGKRAINRRTARVLQMTLEHEGFHIEVSDYPHPHLNGRRRHDS